MAVSRVHGAGRDAAPAGIDLSDALYTLVNRSSTGTFVRPSAGGAVYGSVYETAAAGQIATVAMMGGNNIIKVVAGATVATGAKVMATVAGLAITATATNTVIGVARRGGAVNEILEIVPFSPAVAA